MTKEESQGLQLAIEILDREISSSKPPNRYADDELKIEIRAEKRGIEIARDILKNAAKETI